MLFGNVSTRLRRVTNVGGRQGLWRFSALPGFGLTFGLIFAWVLVRYRFPGKGLVDALIDLPFALPTVVAGIALATTYSENGLVGSLLKPYWIELVYKLKLLPGLKASLVDFKDQHAGKHG